MFLTCSFVTRTRKWHRFRPVSGRCFMGIRIQQVAYIASLMIGWAMWWEARGNKHRSLSWAGLQAQHQRVHWRTWSKFCFDENCAEQTDLSQIPRLTSINLSASPQEKFAPPTFTFQRKVSPPSIRPVADPDVLVGEGANRSSVEATKTEAPKRVGCGKMDTLLRGNWALERLCPRIFFCKLVYGMRMV